MNQKRLRILLLIVLALIFVFQFVVAFLFKYGSRGATAVLKQAIINNRGVALQETQGLFRDQYNFESPYHVEGKNKHVVMQTKLDIYPFVKKAQVTLNILQTENRASLGSFNFHFHLNHLDEVLLDFSFHPSEQSKSFSQVLSGLKGTAKLNLSYWQLLSLLRNNQGGVNFVEHMSLLQTIDDLSFRWGKDFISFKNLFFHLQAKNKDELFSAGLEMGWDEFQFGNYKISQGLWEGRVKNFSLGSLTQVISKFQSMRNFSQTGKNPMQLLSLMKPLEVLLDSQPQVELKRFRLKLNDEYREEMVAHFKIKMGEMVESSPEGKSTLIQNLIRVNFPYLFRLEANGRIGASEKVMQKVLKGILAFRNQKTQKPNAATKVVSKDEVNEAFRYFTGANYIKKSKDMYLTQFLFSGGVLTVNGKKINLPF